MSNAWLRAALEYVRDHAHYGPEAARRIADALAVRKGEGSDRDLTNTPKVLLLK
jgi:hypothetical protein